MAPNSQALEASLNEHRTSFEQASISVFEERSLITGHYSHELSLYRAKKLWEQVLEEYFLLDRNTDFLLQTKINHEKGEFSLWCFFTSACGRYACWRVSHQHAPEALALIEIAHIPRSPSKDFERLFAPNAQISHSEPPPSVEIGLKAGMGIMDTVKNLLSKIVKQSQT